MKFSKTLYVELDADSQDEADAILTDFFRPDALNDSPSITYVDLEGPIEVIFAS